VRFKIAGYNKDNKTVQPIGLLWLETKDDVPMQGNESLFPSFSGFWFSLLLTLSAKQGWRNGHATTNHCCTFSFDP